MQSRAAKAVEISKPTWVRPEGELLEPIVFTYETGYGNLRITDRTVRLARTGQLVEFAVILKDHSGLTGIEILCVDTHKDETIHSHKGNHNSKKETIMEITCDADLDTGYEIAQEMIATKAKEVGEK